MPLLDLPGNVDLPIEIPLSMIGSLACYPFPNKSGTLLFIFLLLLIFVLKILLMKSTELLDYWLIELQDSATQYFLILSSLSDRKPVEREDEIVVMVVPDYQMLEYVERIASDLSDDPVLIWSPQSFIRSGGHHTPNICY